MNHKSELKEAYDRQAAQRNEMKLQDWKVTEREDFLHLLREEGLNRLLEIGAGPGKDSLYFQENGLQVTAVDLSEEMVKLCRLKGLDAYAMDFYELGFADGTFDAVYAFNCLLHVPKASLPRVLREIRRVLKPNGLFFLGVYGGRDSEGIWEEDTYEPKRFFSFFSSEALLKMVGDEFDILRFSAVPTGGDLFFQAMVVSPPKD